MSARFLGQNCVSRRFALLFQSRHKIGERFISHGRFKEIPHTPFAPKFKPRPRIGPYFKEADESIVYHEGASKINFLTGVILTLIFIRELRKYKDDQTRIERQKIKYKRLNLSPYPYREKAEV